jgi:hypothetical protein
VSVLLDFARPDLERVSARLHPIGATQRFSARDTIRSVNLERIPMVLDAWVDCPRCGRPLLELTSAVIPGNKRNCLRA